MGIINRFVGAFAPEKALKRELTELRLDYVRKVRNSGYDQGGASHKKKSFKGWDAVSRSPLEDIDANLDTLRQRSRSLYMTSPLAVSAIKSKKVKEIGPGLRLKSRLDYEFLGISKEEAMEREKIIEREFDIFAKSVWCDALRLHNFYELQSLARASWLLNGDSFAIIKWDEPKPWMPYALRIHLIEGDRVSTPNARSGVWASFWPVQHNTIGENPDNGNKIYNGIEVDDNGAVVAYWICNQYPNSSLFGYGQKREWKRIEAFGERTGNPNVLHLMEPERCEQYRGVPYLAPVIEHLKNITRYQEAELMAALVQALYTVFIEVNNDEDVGDIPMKPIIPEEEQVKDENDDVSYELGPGAVNILGPGEKAVFADPKRPGSGFESFVLTMSKMIGSALDVPYEILLKSFTASYSASRAALLEMWESVRASRTWFVNDFCQPIYELWLAEAVARGRINAPGFFNDPAIKAAWCNAQWTGPVMGQIDPVKEVTAAIMRVGEGFTTREQETIAISGGNWDDNIKQIMIENEQLRAAYPEEAKNGEEGKGGGNDSIRNAYNTIIKKTIERSLTESE